MRLREIQKGVAEELPKLKVNFTSLQNSGKYELTGFQGVIAAINRLAEFNFINDDLGSLKQISQIYYDKSSDDRLILDNHLLTSYQKIIDSIKLKCEAVIHVAEESLPQENQNIIDVKLPNFKSLKETSDFFNDLNKSLEIAIVNKDIGGKVELNSFESGSFWISLALGTKVAVHFVGQIVSAALDLREKYYHTEQLRITTKSLATATEAQETLLKALDDMLKLEVQAKTNQLLEGSPVQDNSPEYISRLTYTVETFTKLIYQGAEIRPALNAPKETKENFPVFPKSLNSLERKLLKENAEEGINSKTDSDETEPESE